MAGDTADWEARYEAAVEVIGDLRSLLGDLHYDETGAYIRRHGHCSQCYNPLKNCFCAQSDDDEDDEDETTGNDENKATEPEKEAATKEGTEPGGADEATAVAPPGGALRGEAPPAEPNSKKRKLEPDPPKTSAE